MADDVIIPLDRLHRAIRSADRWAVQRFQPDKSWDMIEAWQGGRRSLLQWCEKNNVHPTREAEQMLDNLSEGTGFKDR